LNDVQGPSQGDVFTFADLGARLERTLLRRYNREPQAIDAITRSYEKMIAMEKTTGHPHGFRTEPAAPTQPLKIKCLCFAPSSFLRLS
jgi:hypothetical protein